MRLRWPCDLVLWLDLIEGVVAGRRRYPVAAAAIGGALVAFVLFGLIL